MAPKRIPPRNAPTGALPNPQPVEHRGLSFSFKYFVEKTPFVLSDVTPNYAVALFERLRAVCHMTTKELKHNGSDALRCHTIDWGGTTEKGGFGHLNAYLREQIVPYQFSISSGEHGRVHGFFAQEVFYVVWLDLNHKLYS